MREALATKNELAGVPIEETCEKGGWKEGSKMPEMVYSHTEPIKLREKGRVGQAPKSMEPSTSNNAHLNLGQVALLLTAEDRKELKKKQARI